MNSATPLRRFYNDSYDTVFIVVINGDEGSYILTDSNGDAMEYERGYDAREALDESGEFFDVIEVEYHETVDLDVW